jgi:protein phosphatase PTC7
MKSLDKNYDSPFAKRAKQNRMKYRGGKPDDITVIVAQLEENNRSLTNKLL